MRRARRPAPSSPRGRHASGSCGGDPDKFPGHSVFGAALFLICRRLPGSPPVARSARSLRDPTRGLPSGRAGMTRGERARCKSAGYASGECRGRGQPAVRFCVAPSYGLRLRVIPGYAGYGPTCAFGYGSHEISRSLSDGIKRMFRILRTKCPPPIALRYWPRSKCPSDWNIRHDLPAMCEA